MTRHVLDLPPLLASAPEDATESGLISIGFTACEDAGDDYGSWLVRAHNDADSDFAVADVQTCGSRSRPKILARTLWSKGSRWWSVPGWRRSTARLHRRRGEGPS